MIVKIAEDPLDLLADEVLVQHARQGRCDALAVLLKRHEDAVYTIVHNMSGRSSEAEELIYKTIISGWWESSPGPNTSFRTWIFEKAIQTAVAERRGTKAPAWNQLHLADRLREALERLEDRVRAAFVLCDLAELPAQEAALMLQTSVQEIRRRVHSARLTLMRALDRSSPHLSNSPGLNI